MKQLEKIQKEIEIVVGPALPTSKERAMMVGADPHGYGERALADVKDRLESGAQVVAGRDLLDSDEMKVSAAEEYLALLEMQGYIDYRLAQIKESLFETLNSRDRDEVVGDDSPAWMVDAPLDRLPGDVEVPEVGIKFQRTSGTLVGDVVDTKGLQKAHPRIYKSFVKEVVIPAVEERVVETFDEEAFVERASRDRKLSGFVTKKYRNPGFRAHNIFDE